MRQHGFTRSMNVGSGNMKCSVALKSIAARYARHSMLNGYQTDCATAFLGSGDSASDRSAPRCRASTPFGGTSSDHPAQQHYWQTLALSAIRTPLAGGPGRKL